VRWLILGAEINVEGQPEGRLQAANTIAPPIKNKNTLTPFISAIM
jgi:hypothetical protein